MEHEEKQNNIYLIITFEVRTEERDNFRKFLIQVQADLPKEDGCKSVELFEEAHNNQVFTLVELWESELKHQVHLKQIVDSGVWEKIRGQLKKDPVSSYYLKI